MWNGYKSCCQKYQGISIMTEKTDITSFFGSSGIKLWEDTIETLENDLRNQYYQRIKGSPEVSNIFQVILSRAIFAMLLKGNLV